MANVLKVTTPMSGYDNSNNIRGNPEMQNPVNVQGPVNTEKVVRPDARSDAAAQQQDSASMQFKFETNFDNFIQQLRNMPVLAEELPKLLREYMGALNQQGGSSGLAQEIGRFLAMLEISPEKMQSLLKNQNMSAVRYTGAFFDLLRRVMSETGSVELKNSILLFLKRYTDMAESGDILSDIERNIQKMTKWMFPEQSAHLSELNSKMAYQQGASAEQTASNLETLKNEILPFLNNYISITHDRGILRDTTAFIASLIARYENGQMDGVAQAFDRLMEFQAFQKYFQGFDTSRLFELLSHTEFEQASASNTSMEKLADLIRQGISGEAGIETRQVFQQLMRSVLLNESVYMPLLHMFLPVCVDGRMLFSEMWVDPDAGREQENGQEEDSRKVKGLIKFDVQDVGFFDLFFLCSDGKVSLQLNIPDRLTDESGTIQSDIRQIFREHSLETEEFVIGKSNVPIPLTEAFEKIRERKNSINVSI